jgi:hypothetical protein
MERMEKIKTRLKPTDYFYNEVVSIKNPKQYLLYIKKNKLIKSVLIDNLKHLNN